MPNLSAFTGDAGLVLLGSTTLSGAVATVDFASGIGAGYAAYLLLGVGITLASDDAELHLRVSQDAGATWKSGASEYDFRLFGDDGNANINRASSGDAKIVLAGGAGATFAVGNATGEGVSFRATIGRPSVAGIHKLIEVESAWIAAVGDPYWFRGAGRYKGNTNAIDGLRVLAETGNIAAGAFRLYGSR